MRGLNKAYMASVPTFLNAHSLKVMARPDQYSPFANLAWQNVPPVFDFDLQVAVPGVSLIPFAAHTKTNLFGSQRRISAYWLDYDLGADRVCDLNNDANYLFTPMLDGCYIGIRNGRICHIAGNDAYGNSRGNTAAMRNLANNALGGGGATIGFDSNRASATQMTFVGVCNAGTWSWYVQGHDAFIGIYGALEHVYDVNNIIGFPADRGENVIRLTDMKYG